MEMPMGSADIGEIVVYGFILFGIIGFLGIGGLIVNIFKKRR